MLWVETPDGGDTMYRVYNWEPLSFCFSLEGDGAMPTYKIWRLFCSWHGGILVDCL